MYASLNWGSIGSSNGLSSVRHQAITWTKSELYWIETLGINVSGFHLKMQKFPFKKMHFRMSSSKCPPFCSGLHVLMTACLAWNYIIFNRRVLLLTQHAGVSFVITFIVVSLLIKSWQVWRLCCDLFWFSHQTYSCMDGVMYDRTRSWHISKHLI